MIFQRRRAIPKIWGWIDEMTFRKVADNLRCARQSRLTLCRGVLSAFSKREETREETFRIARYDCDPYWPFHVKRCALPLQLQ